MCDGALNIVAPSFLSFWQGLLSDTLCYRSGKVYGPNAWCVLIAIAHKTIRRQRYLDQIANGTAPVMQHFNFLKGGVNPKVACMKQYNLYLYDGLQYGAEGASKEPTGVLCHDGDVFANADWSSKEGCNDFDIPPPPSPAPSQNPEHGT